MGAITIQDLKKQLGPGLGLRKARYILEIPLKNSLKLNILCMATSLPERNMSTTQTWHCGRKFNMRGETEYPGTFELSFTDDSEMTLRNDFDKWMYRIDNSNFGSEVTNNETLKPTGNISVTNGYRTDVTIWQMANDGVTKVRGYRLQEAFPSSIGTVELTDDSESQMSEFSVTFTYSEFIPVLGKGEKIDVGTGGTTQSIANTSVVSNNLGLTDLSLKSIFSLF